MKAVRVHETGGVEALRLDEVPRPQPGPGELLVRVGAAGVNFRDVYQRSGVVPLPLPLTLGLEGAGTVEALGAGVEGFAPGDRVAWAMGQGAYAECALAPAERTVRLPAEVGDDVGAALLAQGLTAHYLSHETFPLQPGQRALVHSGAGGVGLLLIQLAKLRGAEVLTTVSSEEKAALARQAGADHAILYTRQDFAQETRRLTGGEGVHVVYDGVGRDTFQGSLDALRLCGTLVLYGQSSGLVPPFNLYELSDRGSLFVTRPHLIHHIRTREMFLRRAEALLEWVRADRLRVRIGGRYALADAAQAHRDLEARRTVGKLLLLP